MKLRVRLFAAAKEIAGCDIVEVQADDGAAIADVRKALLAAVPALANIVPHALWAVDTQYAARQYAGHGKFRNRPDSTCERRLSQVRSMIQLTDNSIDTSALIDAAATPTPAPSCSSSAPLAS